MFKIFNSKKDFTYECGKMHKKVSKILTDFEVNAILQSNLDNKQKYVIRRFLMKELGCLKGIISSFNSKED